MSLESGYGAPHHGVVFFERREIDRLMRLYARKVRTGEWRAYAIDGLREAAIFSVFRKASENSLYRIEKRPALAKRQGAWSVQGPGGVIVKRGHDLETVLAVFDKGALKVVR